MQGTRSAAGRRCHAVPAESRSGPAPSGWLLLPSGLSLGALTVLSILVLSSLVSPASADAGASEPSSARQRELIHLVRQECGFCHGLRLTGGLGSALTAQVMREKPAETLEAVIRHGIPGTAMPGWAPFLTDSEIRWIVQRLQQGFPNDN